MANKFAVLLVMAILIIVGIILLYSNQSGTIIQFLISQTSSITNVFLLITGIFVLFNCGLELSSKEQKTHLKETDISLDRIFGPTFGMILNFILLGGFAYDSFLTSVDILSLGYQNKLIGLLPSDAIVLISFLMWALLGVSGYILYKLLRRILESPVLKKESAIVPQEEEHGQNS